MFTVLGADTRRSKLFGSGPAARETANATRQMRMAGLGTHLARAWSLHHFESMNPTTRSTGPVTPELPADVSLETRPTS